LTENPLDARYLHGFYLGDLLVEPLKGRVSGKNGAQHLPPKAAEVLVCLARRAGDAVTHEELLKEVWGEGHGTREALSHAISEIRHALDDHPDNPRYIQTLPRRGYRLVVDPVTGTAHTDSIVIGSGAGSTMADLGIFENLKRRGVLETAIAYLVVGWLLIQVADIVFEQLILPDWAGTFVTVLVIAGFPIAVVLSWFLDIRADNAALDDHSPADARRRRFSRTYLSIVGALAVAAVGVFIYDRNIGLPEAEQNETGLDVPEISVSDSSIAVLPFLNNDGSAETQIFANGLVDDVITRLSRVPGLLVSSRGDSATLDPNSPSARVRQRLRVAMYLEGSVEMYGDEIRVIVQLIDSATGFHIQSRTFDRPRKDFFDIRDEVTELTVSSLRVSLPESGRDLTSSADQNPGLDVYVTYRRGIDELDKPRSVATTSTALEWFNAALRADPEFAAAHAGRCDALVWQYVDSNDGRYITEAETACASALELNPNLDVVHAALGDLYRQTGRYAESAGANNEALRINARSVDALLGLSEAQRLLNNVDAAEDSLRKAIGIQPGNWRPYQALGSFLYRQGRYQDAAEQFLKVIALDDTNIRGLSNLATSYMLAGDFGAALPVYERAIQVQPVAATYMGLGLMHYYLGEYDEAIAAMRNAVNLRPNSQLPWMNLGDVLYVSQRFNEARDAFAKAQQLVRASLDVNPNESTLLMDLAWIQAMLGNNEEALRTIARAQELTPDDPYAWYVAALIYNEQGISDATLDALKTAADKGFSRVMISAEPHLANLANDARFLEIADGR